MKDEGLKNVEDCEVVSNLAEIQRIVRSMGIVL